MIYLKDYRKLMKENDPWLETSYDLNLDPKQEPQFEFNFANSGTRESAEQENIENLPNLFYINYNNNSVNFNYTKPQLSPTNPWETTTTPAEIFDEQLLSPASSTHHCPQSTAAPSPCITEDTSDLFDDSDETKVMNFDEYESPPINFEDDFIKYSKMVEIKEQEMIQSYAEKRPLPPTVVVVGDNDDAAAAMSNIDLMLDTAAVSQATFSSQDPTVNPHMIQVNNQSNNYKLEHNYTIIEDDKMVTEEVDEKPTIVVVARTQERRVPKLKLKIPRQVKYIHDYEQKLAVSTPEITNEILDLESQFDLVSYIDSNEAHAVEIVSNSPVEEKPIILSPKRPSSITIDELAADVLRSPKHHPYNTRTRASSPCTSTTSDYFNPGSVQSNTSDDSYTKPAKRRGRPPKPVPSLLDPNEIANLDPEDQRYRELRNKNNEASRRSRLHRRDRETQLEQEAAELEQHNRRLTQQVDRIQRKCEKMKEAVMKIALLE